MDRARRLFVAALAAHIAFIPASSSLAQSRANQSIEGRWQGDFGAGPWTFEFSRQNGAWIGRYTHPKFKGWNQLRRVAAADRAATFTIDSKPSMDFRFKLDGSGSALLGNLKVGATAKQKDVLEVPFQLKRVS